MSKYRDLLWSLLSKEELEELVSEHRDEIEQSPQQVASGTNLFVGVARVSYVRFTLTGDTVWLNLEDNDKPLPFVLFTKDDFGPEHRATR